MPSQKHFRFVIAAAMVVAAAFLAVPPVLAAAPVSGDLVKLPDDGNPDTTYDSAVYYVGSDNKRYVFPNSQTYFTWYADFSRVKTISATEMGNLPIGGNVTYRPGTRLVKITSDPNVYAVEPGGQLRWIQSEAVAKGLYGDQWNRRVDDVPDAYFFSYSIASPLAAAVYPSGTAVKRQSDGVFFLIQDRQKRKIVSADVRNALRIKDADVIIDAGTLADYPDGADLATAESTLADTSQKRVFDAPTVPTLSVRLPASNYINVGGDATLLELHIGAAAAANLQRVTVRIDALTGAPAAGVTDDDLGGLVYGNNARPNLSLMRFVDSAGREPFGRKEIVNDVSQDQTQTFAFTGNFAAAANADAVLYLRVQINRLLPINEKYRATVLVAGTEMTGVTGSRLAFLPAADLTGPELTTINESLRVQSSSNPGSVTYVRGARNAAIAGLTFQATSQAPNVVKSMTVQGYVDNDGVANFLPGVDADNGLQRRVRDLVPQISLYTATGTLIAGPIQVDADGRAFFTGLNINIPAGQSVAVVIKGDVSSSVDLGTASDRVTFDVEDAGVDLVVVDDHGGKVNASGIRPNGGTIAINCATIVKSGTIDFAWQGTTAATLAGKEVLLGKLTADARDDEFSLKTLTFRRAGAVRSMGDIRLEYPDARAQVMSVAGQFNGDIVTFSRLGAVLPKGKVSEMKLYARVPTRDAGGVSGDIINATLVTSGPLEFTSASDGSSYSERDISATTFKISKNEPGRTTVRYTSLAVASGAQSATGYRDNEVPVSAFTIKAEPEGGARIKKLVFRLTPGDAGLTGAKNDALELWPDVNGDFVDDDGVITLRRIYASSSEVLAEGSNGQIRLSEYHGSAKDETPQGFVSAGGDFAQIEVIFPDGSEYFIPAGVTAQFRLDADTAALASDKDYSLKVDLLGGDEFAWTDLPTGNYTALGGGDTAFSGIGSSITIRK